MIRQVRLSEVYVDATGNLVPRGEAVFAFGTHPQVTSVDEAHAVTSAKAVSNKLRIIMDELLVGNHLEEIKCRYVVDDDDYSSVAVGTTPDDVARCSVPRDVLKASCPGTSAHAVCVCQLDGGCGNVDAMTGKPEFAKGDSVGVVDTNQDGAADDTRFIRGAVGLKCDDIDVPVDLENSYWNPSGDQNVPAMGGFDALGPAIVLTPSKPAKAAAIMAGLLPTNTTCGLVFAPNVVDKQGIQVCAPPDGDVAKTCTPGDATAFSFKVEPLSVRSSVFSMGTTGISRTMFVPLKFSAHPDPDTLAGITVTQGTTPYTQFTLEQPPMSSLDIVRVNWTAAGGLDPNTEYTITVPTTVKDFYGQPLPMPTTFTFTTGS